MITYLINIIITLVFTLLTAELYSEYTETAFSYVLLFLGWYIITWLFSFFYSKSHFYKVPKIIGLMLYFLNSLIRASLRVAYDIITPQYSMKPALVIIPLDAKTDLEITLLANLITLTPGTLSIDIGKDKKTLLIHEVYVRGGDVDAVVKEIKEGFERRILNITR